MPLYEYECRKCGRHTEKIEKVSGPHLRKCPHCGGAVERLLSPPAVQFKGTGWYVTDYAAKSASKDAAEGKTSGESKEAATKESSAKDAGGKDSKSGESKESKDKKPAKKK